MNSYAIRHPRLDVVAVITAKSSLDAMRLLMARDATWGDLGLNEAVWLNKRPGPPSYSLFGQHDCGDIASIKEAIVEIDRRRAKPQSRQIFDQILRLAAKKARLSGPSASGP